MNYEVLKQIGNNILVSRKRNSDMAQDILRRNIFAMDCITKLTGIRCDISDDRVVFHQGGAVLVEVGSNLSTFDINKILLSMLSKNYLKDIQHNGVIAKGDYVGYDPLATRAVYYRIERGTGDCGLCVIPNAFSPGGGLPHNINILNNLIGSDTVIRGVTKLLRELNCTSVEIQAMNSANARKYAVCFVKIVY